METIIKIEFNTDSGESVLTNSNGDTFSSKNEELKDFLTGCKQQSIKPTIVNAINNIKAWVIDEENPKKYKGLIDNIDYALKIVSQLSEGKQEEPKALTDEMIETEADKRYEKNDLLSSFGFFNGAQFARDFQAPKEEEEEVEPWGTEQEIIEKSKESECVCQEMLPDMMRGDKCRFCGLKIIF